MKFRGVAQRRPIKLAPLVPIKTYPRRLIIPLLHRPTPAPILHYKITKDRINTNTIRYISVHLMFLKFNHFSNHFFLISLITSPLDLREEFITNIIMNRIRLAFPFVQKLICIVVGSGREGTFNAKKSRKTIMSLCASQQAVKLMFKCKSGLKTSTL